MRFLIIAGLLWVIIPYSVFADHADTDEIKIVQAEGTAVLGENTTLAQAKNIALNNARRSALEQAVGVQIKGSSVIYNSDMISDYVVAATKGLIVRERFIEEPSCQGGGGNIRCRTKIEAHVKPLKQVREGRFRIRKAAILSPGRKTAAKAPVFNNDDEMQVSVRVSENSYVSIFSIDQYGNVSKLFPNQHFSKNSIPADEEFIFPDDIQRNMGVKLRVRTPEKLNKAVESVMVIATKEKVDFLADHADELPTVSDLMREISEVEPSMWSEKTLGYEVRK